MCARFSARSDPQVMSALTYITTFSLSGYLGNILSRYFRVNQTQTQRQL